MSEEPVIISREGSLGRLHLNRPKAINSLTLEMVRLIDKGLTEFEGDDSIASVLITGEGERGLCAGGDIIALYESGKAKTPDAERFWAEEYVLNARIAAYPKPYVAFMDGITMGGGVGVSAHGSHRIVTDRTRLAMPETGIGFFPDVGGTWILGRAAGEVGTYIGLTGASFGAADAIYAGFADYYMPAGKLGDLAAALAGLPADAGGSEVDAAIKGLAEGAPGATIAENRAAIDAAFAADTVEEIIAALEAQGTEFAQKTLKTLGQKSPTSLKITLGLLRAARGSKDLKECLDREFAATGLILEGPDFYEGVRAAVIDKDRNPTWVPATLAEAKAPDLGALAAAHDTLFNS
ncbi:MULTISPECIES: enoyl-CoA hydratase/isomerase family protein [Actibacterium]|uniref:3-hydroxyisobutyryl-CoA hydrolase n=1 Tax=Actibacterium naphthalenivorans TaxID=1614693 RepID=A0A840CDS0_9RHOB|nr:MULTISPECIES: enoyl-CoA hydratase/isomerase family protein [Actibacterium]ALG91667.1 3-hydroxyisobutyryl-CoA hydrolase [Actibacterium sp. EMB200-NS6]MBB4021688.1 enoyl-CoA hydratase [Actibacterium naphthalenivorans]